jgi:hypothetical protein
MKQKHTIYIISLVQWLGWVFKTQERKNNISLVIITITSPQSIINIQKHHFKTTFMCPWSIAGVPSGRAPYYCTPPVTVPAVLGGLTVWRHNNKKKNLRYHTRLPVCTCCACFAKNIMSMYQQFPQIWYVSQYGLGLVLLCWREAAVPLQQPIQPPLLSHNVSIL